MTHKPSAQTTLHRKPASAMRHTGAFARRVFGLALTLVAWCALVPYASAQNVQFTQGSVGSGLDNTLQIQLRAYPGRGQASIPITLYYSSKVWRIGHLADVHESVDGYWIKRSITEAIYAEHSAAGWTTSLNVPKVEWPKVGDTFWYTGKPYHNSVYPYTFRMACMWIHMPDGSTHELRKSYVPFSTNYGIDMSGTFYATDGSRMRYDSTGENTGTLYLPDGTRYILNEGSAQFIDRNGNTLNYNDTAKAWTDTLGRTIGVPLQAGQSTYSVPGVGGTQLTYTFVWRPLSQALVPDSQNVTPTLKVASTHYLPNPGAAPTNQGAGNFPASTSGDSLFHSDYGGDGESASSYTYVVGRGQGTGVFNPTVLAEIVFPNGLKYSFGYNAYGEIVKITYPTGGHELCDMGEVTPPLDPGAPYSQGSRGVKKRLLSADGSGTDYAVWEYSSTGTIVTTKAPDGTVTDIYRYAYNTTNTFGIDDPRSGAVREERIYAPNPSPSGPTDIRGPMLRRKLINTVTTQGSIAPRSGVPSAGNNTIYYQRSARPDKEVSLILDTGGAALAKTSLYGYDTTYESTTGLDLTSTTETNFATVDVNTAQTGDITQMSQGTTASIAETTYLNGSEYRSRNILGLPTSVVLKDGNQQVVSKTQTGYDEATLQTYNDFGTDWTDPGAYRGNATKIRRYLDVSADVPLTQGCPAGVCLDTRTYFDQVGNVWKVADARGVETVTTFGGPSTNRHAYPTLVTTDIPDSTGIHGSNAAFTLSNIYDPNTGFVISTTNANGQTTQFKYKDDQDVADPINRILKVIRPDGSWTSYSYHDTVGDLYTETKASFDATRSKTTRQYYDKMGRSVRVFSYENSAAGTPWVVADTYYDLMGRVSQVSNPYRTAAPSATPPSTCALCMTSTYDALGRVKTSTLADGTSVQTYYQGIYITVTDQAGKSRRQKADALGRIVRVDEPDASGNLGGLDAPVQPTYYQYNTHGSLVQVSQGLTQAGLNPEDPNSYQQQRYFKYDALSRLTYERQVEQAAVFTAADSLTSNNQWSRKISYDETIEGVSYPGLVTSMTDARGIRTEYNYDKLGRIYKVTYSDGTPTITNYYDQQRVGYQLNKGHLTTVTTESVAAHDQVPEIPATSQVYDYDLMGRVVRQQQLVGGNTYTLSYGYNLAGDLTSQTYPSGRVVNYSYNDAAGLSGVTSGDKTYASQFDYSSPQGLLKSVSLGNGTVESFDYNSRLQLNSISLTKNNSTLQKYEYRYGKVNVDGTVDETKNNGQIGRIEGFIGTAKQWQQRFSYDSLGRLSQAGEYRGDNGQQSYLINYDYDTYGNRYQKLSRNPAGDNPLSPVYVEDADISKATNRFTFSQVSYDGAGNITVDGKFRVRQYQYDANNRQRYAAATDGTGGAWSVYDGAGHRVATISGGVMSVLIYDTGGKLVAEYGTSISTIGGTQYVFSDHQGSTRVVTNQGGGIISRQDYQPFGEELSAVGMRSTDQYYGGGNGTRQKYAGMERDDASGMAHTLWRKYDGMSGRWTSPDPYGGSMSVGDPQSFNRYSYVNNDPVNQTDALGLMAGADQGWSSVASGFWGSSAGFNEPHFEGLGIIENGMNGFPDRAEEEEEEEEPEEEEAQEQQQEAKPTAKQMEEAMGGEEPPEMPTPITEDEATRKLYNCMAWALGISNKWVEPAMDGNGGYLVTSNRGTRNKSTVRKPYEPEVDPFTGQVNRPPNMTMFDIPREFGGKKSSATESLRADQYRIVVFSDSTSTSTTIHSTHVMRQEADGTWSSKNGQGPRFVGIKDPVAYYNNVYNRGQFTRVEIKYYKMPTKLLTR